MNKYSDNILTVVAVVLFVVAILFMNGSQDQKIAAQAKIIEQLQDDVKAMTSAFEEMSLNLLKSHYAYLSWSAEIRELRDAKDQAPEIPEIGRWRNRKEETKQ